MVFWIHLITNYVLEVFSLFLFVFFIKFDHAIEQNSVSDMFLQKWAPDILQNSTFSEVLTYLFLDDSVNNCIKCFT